MPQVKAKSPKTSNSKGMSKMEAVRRALGHLGADAKPLSVQPYILKECGVTMDTNMISSYKSFVNKQGASKSRVTRHAGRGAAVDLCLEDIQAVKELTGRIGADKVRELAELFE